VAPPLVDIPSFEARRHDLVLAGLGVPIVDQDSYIVKQHSLSGILVNGDIDRGGVVSRPNYLQLHDLNLQQRLDKSVARLERDRHFVKDEIPEEDAAQASVEAEVQEGGGDLGESELGDRSALAGHVVLERGPQPDVVWDLGLDLVEVAREKLGGGTLEGKTRARGDGHVDLGCGAREGLWLKARARSDRDVNLGPG